jgi:phosphoserine phosphatase
MADPPVRLVVFDMEGCLTDDPTVWEIMHRKLGTWDSHGAVYWERYRAGGLDYDEFARMDVAVWAGAPAALLHEAAAEVPLMPGCETTLAALRRAGVAAAIVSNGLLCVAERLRDRFGVACVRANRALAAGDRLTGELELSVPYESKAQALREIMAQAGVRAGHVAAVGDTRADVAMFREARISVAFRAGDAAVRAAATHTIADGSLTALLPIVGVAPDTAA